MITDAEFGQVKLQLQQAQRHIQDLQAGRLHPVGVVFLDPAPATSTVVEAEACISRSTVHLTALNSASAAEAVAGSLRVDPDEKFFTVYHTSSAAVRTFQYSILSPT